MSLVGFKAQNHPQQPKKDAVDDRGTDPEFFARMVERFGPFTVDVAAAPHNAKCDRYYTIDDDGLSKSWAGESTEGRLRAAEAELVRIRAMLEDIEDSG